MSASLAMLPGWKPYAYRGTGVDTLTPFLDEEPEPDPGPGPRKPGQWRNLKPCGTAAAVRRHQRRKEPLDFDCRVFNATRSAKHRTQKLPAGSRCDDCGYLLSSQNHRIVCGVAR